MASSLFAGRRNSLPPSPTRNEPNDLMPQLIRAAKAGKHPKDVLPKLAQQYPAVKQAMEIISANTPEQVTGIIQDMAAKRGSNVAQLINMLGIR